MCVLEPGGAGERAAADGIVDDALDRGLVIAERGKTLRHHTVDDLEIAAAGELLEFDQREVRLDAGGIAVHDETDSSGRRDHCRLRVAVAMLPAKLDGALPRMHGAGEQLRIRAGGVVEWHRRGLEILVALSLTPRGAGVIAHDPEHVLAVLLEARERPKLPRHVGAGG